MPLVQMPRALQTEKRARIIKADAELEASQKLAEAAQLMVGNPAALELRRMQMVAEVAAENNSTTVIVFPPDFVHLAGSVLKSRRKGRSLSAYRSVIVARKVGIYRPMTDGV